MINIIDNRINTIITTIHATNLIIVKIFIVHNASMFIFRYIVYAFIVVVGRNICFFITILVVAGINRCFFNNIVIVEINESLSIVSIVVVIIVFNTTIVITTPTRNGSDWYFLVLFLFGKQIVA